MIGILWDSSVSILTNYVLDDRVSISFRCKNDLCSISYMPALQPIQLPPQLVPEAHFLGMKLPEREANHSSPLVPRLKIFESVPPLHSTFHSVVFNETQ
jgi:hypothetical protein